MSQLLIRTLERLQLEADLQSSIEAKEFYLNYQPIISLATEKVVSFEALVRWQHPQRGLISPAKFIPFAEETTTSSRTSHILYRT